MHIARSGSNCIAAKHGSESKKDLGAFASRSLLYLGWLMGLEPTTTGITILDSTN